MKPRCTPSSRRDDHFPLSHALIAKVDRKCGASKVLVLLELWSRAMTLFRGKFHPFLGESRITFYALSNEPIKKGGKDFTQKSLLKFV